MYPILNKCGIEIYVLQRKKMYVYTLPVEYITLVFIYIQKQDRHLPINITFRRVGVTSFAFEKQWLLHILTYVYNLSYPACKVHSPYCHLWPVSLYHISHFLSQTARFSRRKVTEYETGVLIFSMTFVWNASHSKKN